MEGAQDSDAMSRSQRKTRRIALSTDYRALITDY
jgi:hypothetical protein